MEVNFSLTIVLLVFAAKNVFADTKSPFAQQPQHYSVVQTSKNFPVDLQYPVQQAINEVDSNEPAQNQVSIRDKHEVRLPLVRKIVLLSLCFSNIIIFENASFIKSSIFPN